MDNKNTITLHSLLGPGECFVEVNIEHATERRIRTLKKFYPGAILITDTNYNLGLTLLDYFHSYKPNFLKQNRKKEFIKTRISLLDITIFESKAFNFNRKSFSNLYDKQRKTLEKNLRVFPETIKILKYNPSVEIDSNFNDSFDSHKYKSKINISFNSQIHPEILNNSYFDC